MAFTPDLTSSGTLTNKSSVNLQNVLSITDRTGNQLTVGNLEVMAVDAILADEVVLYNFGEIQIASKKNADVQTQQFKLPKKMIADVFEKTKGTLPEARLFGVDKFYLRINKLSRYISRRKALDVISGREQDTVSEILQNQMLSLMLIESARFYNEIRSFYRSGAEYSKDSNAGADEIKGASGNAFVWSGDTTDSNTEIKEKEALSTICKAQIVSVKDIKDLHDAGTLSADKMRSGAYAMQLEKIMRKIALLIDNYTTMVNNSLIRMYVAPWLFEILRYTFSTIKHDTSQVESKSKIQTLNVNGVLVAEDKLIGQKIDAKVIHESEAFDFSNVAGFVMITKTVPFAIGNMNQIELQEAKTTDIYNHLEWESGVGIWPAKTKRIVILSNLDSGTYTI